MTNKRFKNIVNKLIADIIEQHSYRDDFEHNYDLLMNRVRGIQNMIKDSKNTISLNRSDNSLVWYAGYKIKTNQSQIWSSFGYLNWFGIVGSNGHSVLFLYSEDSRFVSVKHLDVNNDIVKSVCLFPPSMKEYRNSYSDDTKNIGEINDG